jgi:hypothetical protein
MNAHDRSNFQFIMSLSQEQFDEWYSSISLDDIEYAIELCQAARLELAMNVDEVKDTTQAKQTLKKFML